MGPGGSHSPATEKTEAPTATSYRREGGGEGECSERERESGQQRMRTDARGQGREAQVAPGYYPPPLLYSLTRPFRPPFSLFPCGDRRVCGGCGGQRKAQHWLMGQASVGCRSWSGPVVGEELRDEASAERGHSGGAAAAGGRRRRRGRGGEWRKKPSEAEFSRSPPCPVAEEALFF